MIVQAERLQLEEIARRPSVADANRVERRPVQLRGREPLRQPAAQPQAEKAVAAFNSWSFKREQPDSRELLLALAQRCEQARAPLRFVMYWGKGPKPLANDAEEQCLAYLHSMLERVRGAYDHGAELNLIFTDSHAALNGYGASEVAAYFRSVRAMAGERVAGSCHLASLVRDARPLIAGETRDEALDPALREELVASAAKWFRGEGAVEEGAETYFRANMVERRAVELAFPDAVFVTFNGSRVRALFPLSMPIFYMYSLRKGFAVKPWFMA